MIRPVRVLLFDLGNTLFHDNPRAWPRIYLKAEAALWKSLHRSGVQVAPEQVYGRPDTLLSAYYRLRGTGTLEPGTFRLLRDLLLLHVSGISDSAITDALRAMYAVTQTNWRVEAGAARTLRALERAGYPLGAVSNGSDDANALELLRRSGLKRYFEFVITSAAHGRRKPEPSIFQAALDHFHAKPEDAAMIGDSYEADILGGLSLGLQTIWVTRRVPADSIPVATREHARVDSLAQLPPLLARAS